MLGIESFPEPSFKRGHHSNLTATSVSTVGTLSIPKIRILLAPYMSPYVVPMRKVETWELLLNLLGHLFGESVITSTFKVTDTQGNVIHKHVWEDLLEPGMTVVLDTGSLDSQPTNEHKPKEANLKEKEKVKVKQIQAALPFGQPPDPPAGINKPLPKLSQSRDDLKAEFPKPQPKPQPKPRPEGKLPDEIIEQWVKETPVSPVRRKTSTSAGAEEKRITTVSMFLHQGLNGSKVTLGQMNLDRDVEKMGIVENRTIVRAQTTMEKPPVPLQRKKSTVARVAERFHGIKSRYGSLHAKETTPTTTTGLGIITETTVASQKQTVPEAKTVPQNLGNQSTVSATTPATFTTTASGAISNKPIKPARRTASFKAFFRYFDDGKPVPIPRRTKSTPISPAVNKEKEPQHAVKDVPPRPTTAPPTTAKSPLSRQPGNPVDTSNSGYISDISPLAGESRQRTPIERHDTSHSSRSPKSPKSTASKPPVVDKPLPKVPYKFSAFPPQSPPRSPIIKAGVRPVQSQPQLSTGAKSQLPSQSQQAEIKSISPPPMIGRIIPWDELNRRLAKETQFSSGGVKQRKSSISAAISHRRGRSADSTSTYSMASSAPLSFGLSTRASTAVVKDADIAINGFGMRSKLVSVGKIGFQQTTTTVPDKTPGAAAAAAALAPPSNKKTLGGSLGKSVRRVASDDTIRSGSGSWRRTDHRRAELRKPLVATENEGVGLGIDLSEEAPKVEPLEVSGGRTIAIGVIPED